MKKICDQLLSVSERFLNLFLTDKDQRMQYADTVWDMVQKAYSAIGGIKGSGFSSKQDMVDTISFWKIAKRNGKVVAVAFYKDKKGRKRVDVATDGTPQGKEQLARIMVEDLTQGRSWVEVSGPSWKFLKRSVPDVDVLKKMVIPFEEVKKLLGDDVEPADPKDAQAEGEFAKFFYRRKLGNAYSLKIAIGTPGKVLK